MIYETQKKKTHIFSETIKLIQIKGIKGMALCIKVYKVLQSLVNFNSSTHRRGKTDL